MLYYKITAKESESANQIIRTLKNSRTWAISNGNPLEIYSATGNNHTTHVLGIARQFNAEAKEIAKDEIPQEITRHGGIPKREYIAFDNTVFSDKNLYAQYERNQNPKNIKARALKPAKIRKPRSAYTEPNPNSLNGECKTVARLEPNQSFNMDGAIASLKILEDKLLQAYTEVSELGKALDKIEQYNKLLKDKADYVKTARMLLEKA